MKRLTPLILLLTLASCSYPSKEDAMKSCVKWGNKGVSIRSYKYGLTSHTRECIYDKKNKRVIGYEKDAKNTKAKRTKYFDYQ